MNFRTVACGALLAGTVMAANASDYGCTVLLCLANPNGPKAVSQCVPPITKLFKDLAKGKPFPKCDLASAPSGGSGGKSWAEQGTSYYDPCPTGTSALPAGSFAVKGSAVTVYQGIGDGDDLSPGSGDDYNPLPGKVCVGKKVSDTTVSMGTGDGYVTYDAGVYDNVVMLDPAGSPRVIDVYVDSALYRRVRW